MFGNKDAGGFTISRAFVRSCSAGTSGVTEGEVSVPLPYPDKGFRANKLGSSEGRFCGGFPAVKELAVFCFVSGRAGATAAGVTLVETDELVEPVGVEFVTAPDRLGVLETEVDPYAPWSGFSTNNSCGPSVVTRSGFKIRAKISFGSTSRADSAT